MKEIPLTQGKVALVDDEDYEELSKHKWYASRNQCGGLEEIWYAVRTDMPSRRNVFMHQQVMPAESGQLTFHKNHDGLDNRSGNLQVAERWKVVAHRRVRPRNLPRGVYPIFQSKRLKAMIRVGGRTIHLGCFSDAEEASANYRAAHLHYFGEPPTGPICVDPIVSGLNALGPAGVANSETVDNAHDFANTDFGRVVKRTSPGTAPNVRQSPLAESLPISPTRNEQSGRSTSTIAYQISLAEIIGED
jgi:hypothetical protein